MNDAMRMALMLVVTNILSVLTGFAIVDWTLEQVGIVNALVDSGLLLVMFFWKSGQSA